MNGLFNSRKFHFVLRSISVAVWLFALIICLGNLGWTEKVSSLPLLLKVVINVLAGALELIAIPGSFIIWISMLIYWSRFDSSPRLQKALWLTLMVFGFCFGASIYYSSKLRHFGRDAQVLQPTTPSHDGRGSLASAMKPLVIGLWSIVAVLVVLSFPTHSLISDKVIAGTAFIVVPLAFLSSAVLFFDSVVRNGLRK